MLDFLIIHLPTTDLKYSSHTHYFVEHFVNCDWTFLPDMCGETAKFLVAVTCANFSYMTCQITFYFIFYPQTEHGERFGCVVHLDHQTLMLVLIITDFLDPHYKIRRRLGHSFSTHRWSQHTQAKVYIVKLIYSKT